MDPALDMELLPTSLRHVEVFLFFHVAWNTLIQPFGNVSDAHK